METSVHKLSDCCVESVLTHLYTSCQTDVRSLYEHIFTQGIRLICVVCMKTSVHQLSECCVESVWRHLYTIFSDWCVESVWTSLYTSCQTDVWSLYGQIFTQVFRLMCVIYMDTYVHQLQNDVCSLYGDICTLVFRLMCGVCIVTSVHQTSEWCVECVWRHLYTRSQTDVRSLYGNTSLH
jgi:hypothetical protein